MINSELLKEAIADAKAVRATALANAKASLEEAFAPRFEAMFAEKLKEDSEEEQEEMVAEVEAPNQVSGAGGEAKGPKTKAVSKGQPKKVSDAASNFKTVAVGGSEGAAGSKAPAATQSIVKETAEEEEEEGKKMDETVAEAGLTSEDLDEIIKELEAEVAGEEGGEEEAEVPAPAPAPEEPAAEIPPAPEGDAAPAPVAPAPAPAACDPACAAAPAPAPVAPAPEGGEAPAPVAPAPTDDEEINLEELLASLNEEAEEEEEESKKVEEAKDNGVPKNVGGQDAALKTTSNKDIEATKNPNHNISGKGNIGSGEVGGKPKMEEGKYKVALKEAYDTIRFLRGQINEVNLLNAKLLYTNKLFKEFAGVLDDGYRLKIVESFDLTKSVREVKLAYALLAESLSFGTKVNAPKAPAAKPAPKKVVTQITEGLASKPVASTKPSGEIITEATEMASRFKKLAGIKEAPKK